MTQFRNRTQINIRSVYKALKMNFKGGGGGVYTSYGFDFNWFLAKDSQGTLKVFSELVIPETTILAFQKLPI